MGKVNTNIPVTFEVMNRFDDRFMQVKIYLMHTGLNYNGSIFNKDVVEKAIPSLKNTPILGYVQANAIGKEDFAGHEMELIVKDGEYQMKYLGSAYGVIPETNNARWETKMGDNNQSLEYLVVDGLMWTKFNDAIDIMNRDSIKGQSMELDKNYNGSFDQDGNFVFSDFSFYGACILGDGVQPAMQQATIEKMFSADGLFSEINEKMEEFKLNYGNISIDNSKEVKNVNVEEILSKFGVTTEQLKEKEINVADYSTEEELEAKLSEVFGVEETPEVQVPEPTPEPTPEVVVVDGGDGSQTPQVDPEGEFSTPEGDKTGDEDYQPEGNFEASNGQRKIVREFVLSHSDIRSQLYDKLDSYVQAKGLGDAINFWINDVYDNYFISIDESSRNYYKIDYTVANDNVTLGDCVQVYPQFLTSEEKGALDMMRSTYQALELEVKELKDFKKETEKGMHEEKANELFEKFGLEEGELIEVKNNIHNFSLEQIEEKLFAFVGRKNFSLEQQKNKVTIVKDNSDITKSEKAYGGIFSKHGIKSIEE